VAVFSRSDDESKLAERNVALSDELLLERMAGGDTASFDALFYRHYDRVYGLLFRLLGDRAEAEDMTQEAFLKLHGRAGFGRRPREDENVGAWLYRVAMNLGYNALRARRRRQQRDVYLLPEDETGVEGQVDSRRERAAVRAALARLPERQAQLLLLRQMGFSYAECAAICEVAPGSVGTLLSRAAEAFRREYRKSSEAGRGR
jgi:RNA polymerase sigma-70 factor (ECF subfamily)